MNVRENKIFLSLVYQKDYLSIEQLAELNDVSQRSIYNDLNQIDKFLIANGLVKLERKKGEGVRYLVEKEKLEKINSLILNSRNQSYLEPGIRRYRLIQLLLFKNDYITLDELSNTFLVSRNTIANDIQEIKSFFANKQLQLASYPFRGLKVEGSELAKRRGMVSLYSELTQEDVSKSDEFLLDFISTDELKKINVVLKVIEKELSYPLTDLSFNEFKLHLMMAVYRNRKKHTLDLRVLNIDISHSREYEVIMFVKKDVEEMFKISFSADELRFLSLQLMSSSVQANLEVKELTDFWVPLQLGTYELIEAVSKELDVPLLHDQVLFQGLLNHIRPAYYRIIGGEKIENPLLNEIRDNYTNIHQAVVENIKSLEMYLNLFFNEDELSFVTMYFAGAIERQQQIKRIKPRIIIICSSGISTSQMLASQIENLFDVNIVGAYSYRDASEILEKNEIDLVITTIDMTIDSPEVIKVNAILDEQDLSKLRKKFFEIDTEIDIEYVMKLVSKHADVLNYTKLQDELKLYLQPNSSRQSYKGVREPMLIEVLNESLIATQQKISDKEAAVRKSGELLLKNDLIEERYIEAMVDNLRENGNYIVIAPGIAMPHARPEDGAKDIGFSLVTLAEPIKFGHKTNDPVQIIFGLCAVDHQSHLQALAELVEILAVQDNIDKMIAARTPSDVMKIIKESV